MNIKLAVFDLDDTLAYVGKPITQKNVKLLKEIESRGIKIAISSGKPVYYQIGMFRQVGLNEPIFIGENGCSIAFGTKLPPKMLETVKADDEFFKVRDKVLADLGNLCGDNYWLQPNEVMLTLFFKDSDTRDVMRGYFKNNPYKGATIYEHIDSFDVVPSGTDKKTSLATLSKALNISCDEMIAVGDGVNDIPMFEFCGYSIGVYDKLSKSLTTYHYDCIEKGLKQILRMTYDKQV